MTYDRIIPLYLDLQSRGARIVLDDGRPRAYEISVFTDEERTDVHHVRAEFGELAALELIIASLEALRQQIDQGDIAKLSSYVEGLDAEREAERAVRRWASADQVAVAVEWMMAHTTTNVNGQSGP